MDKEAKIKYKVRPKKKIIKIRAETSETRNRTSVKPKTSALRRSEKLTQTTPLRLISKESRCKSLIFGNKKGEMTTKFTDTERMVSEYPKKYFTINLTT